jgi:hypothetical protein
VHCPLAVFKKGKTSPGPKAATFAAHSPGPSETPHRRPGRALSEKNTLICAWLCGANSTKFERFWQDCFFPPRGASTSSGRPYGGPKQWSVSGSAWPKKRQAKATQAAGRACFGHRCTSERKFQMASRPHGTRGCGRHRGGKGDTPAQRLHSSTASFREDAVQP